MKKKILGPVFLGLSILLYSSCKKETAGNNNKNATPSSLMTAALLADANADYSDFTVLISNSHPVSLLEDYPTSRTSTIIQGSSKLFKNAGTLSVNNSQIPYGDEAMTYFLQTDVPGSQVTSPMFTGSEVRYGFTSQDETTVPSFGLSQYSPAVTNLQYTGLSHNLLSRNGTLTVKWTPDPKMPKDNAVLVIYSKDNTEGKIDFVTKEVSDKSGGYTLTPDDFSRFSQDKSIDIFYARGYEQLEHIAEKELSFQFIGFSWSTIYFAN